MDTVNRYGVFNKSNIFYKPDGSSGWKNIPQAMSNGVVIGLREVSYRTSGHILIKITEFYPIPGKQYYAFYNTGTWGEWKCIGNKAEAISITFQNNSYFGTPDTLKITKTGNSGYLYIRMTSKNEIPAWTDVIIGNATIVPREDIEANIIFDTGAAARVIFNTNKTVRITALSNKIIGNSVARACIPVAFN